MTSRNYGALGLLLIAATPHVYGQVASRVSGTVLDTTGAVIPGVAVTLQEIYKGTTQSTLSNEAGRYSFPCLWFSQTPI